MHPLNVATGASGETSTTTRGRGASNGARLLPDRYWLSTVADGGGEGVDMVKGNHHSSGRGADEDTLTGWSHLGGPPFAPEPPRSAPSCPARYVAGLKRVPLALRPERVFGPTASLSEGGRRLYKRKP